MAETLSPAPKPDPNTIEIRDKSCNRGTWEGPEGQRLTWWQKMSSLLNPFDRSPEEITDYGFKPDNPDAYQKAAGHNQPGTMRIRLKK